MAVTINFKSPGNPPNNITQFRIERSVRAADGTIALAGDVDNVTKIVTVTFTGTPPADGTLAGDQMEIGGLLYNIVTNTSTTITFTAETDLSTITVFPATFIILNDLAEFSSFEVIGTVSPSIPFSSNIVHQFSDPTGTIFDFYQIRTIDSGGSIGADPLVKPFNPGGIVTLGLDDAPREEPQDSLLGIINGSITFEVTVEIGGRAQDPKDNTVIADLFMPSYLSPDGTFKKITTLTMARVGQAKYRATWNVPESVGPLTIFPGDDYIVSYKGNFVGLVDSAPDNFQEFASEHFVLQFLDGPILGRFPAYATPEDVRMTLFEVDAYLPEALAKSDLDGRNRVLRYHLERASDKLREELNMHQIRSSSSDRKEFVASRAVYTILMAARGQNSSAVSNEFLKFWHGRWKEILEQLKREGVAQGIPLGRG